MNDAAALAIDRPPSPPTLEIEAGRATIRLHRPAHHNRLETTDIETLAGLFAQIERDETIRVLVLAASGKSFCAGYDLKDLATTDEPVASGEDAGHGGIGVFAGMVDQIEACRVPTIAALNGPVYGGGTDLALACDFRIGVAACRMFMPAGRFGLHYYHSGLRRYLTRMTPGAAKRLFLLGETFEAAEMLRVGYLDEIVADEDALLRRVDEMAATILAAASARVLNSMKRELNRIAAADMDREAADRAWSASRRSPEVAAAVAQHLAARKAKGAAKPPGS
jgi:enoyl-CoA hydratase/carnithine racemase